MALRAVIFDFGLVLSEQQQPAAYAELLRITGLSREQFEPAYWADRHAYDEGKLTGLEFWQKLIHNAGLNLSSGSAEELNRWDGLMWSSGNPAMLAWQEQLQLRGLRTAILSNMGDGVHRIIEQECPWIARFDVQVWSYQLRIAKPDPAIYRHTLEKLGAQAQETLFLDDKKENIRAAEALGIRAIQFSTVERLRIDLHTAGLDAQLPLPG